MLTGQHIILGITGSIAAYKAALLTRLLTTGGAEVQVVMTPSAGDFIGPLTLQALSGRTVREALLDANAEASGMGHIELARWADQIVIAPASADFIARLAGGRANDLLSALCLASEAPVVVVPAMNRLMWEKPAVRRNVARLEADGMRVLPTDEGEQACGEHGAGRMMESNQICDYLAATKTSKASAGLLAGHKVVITAGPTQEPIDPVRFIGNRSSGKQGFALAAACAAAGADVTLIAGPVELTTPSDIAKRIDVCTAVQMHRAAMREAAAADLFIGVAAVADYRPLRASCEKIKKVPLSPEHSDSESCLSVELIENPDIIASVATLKQRPFMVGFAAETEHTTANAKAKLARKGLDMIIVNDVSNKEIGFGSDENEVTLITKSAEKHFEKCNKDRLSRHLVEHIAAALTDAEPA